MYVYGDKYVGFYTIIPASPIGVLKHLIKDS